MDRSIASAPARTTVRTVAMVAAAAMLTVTAGSGVVSQTLTDPNPQTKWSPPRTAAKSPPAGYVKTCTAYGAGFVNVPGTDLCVKIGGYVRSDITSSPEH